MTVTNIIGQSLVALAQDAMSYYCVAGTSVAGLALGQSIERLLISRMERARDILLEELSAGRATIDDIPEADEIVAIFYCYTRAAQEGAARLNLRLMAKVIAGQKESRTLTANEFLYHADILASLRREEIVLLATLYKQSRLPEVLAEESKRGGSAMRAAMSELIPSVFKDEDEFIATAAGTMRTGLMIGLSGLPSIFYKPSPLMDKLYALAPFEAALAQEA